MYKILYSQQSVKFIKKLDSKRQEKVKTRMEQVAKDPFAHDPNLNKIKEMTHGYRLRIGDIRLVYETNSKELQIIVWKTDWRGSVYAN